MFGKRNKERNEGGGEEGACTDGFGDSNTGHLIYIRIFLKHMKVGELQHRLAQRIGRGGTDEQKIRQGNQAAQARGKGTGMSE